MVSDGYPVGISVSLSSPGNKSDPLRVGGSEGGEVVLNPVGLFSDTEGVGTSDEVVIGDEVGEDVSEVAVTISPPESTGNVGSKSKRSSVEFPVMPKVVSGLDTFPDLPGTKLLPGLSICCMF